ncbi:MAG: cytochrome c biogenesis protein CcsA [Coriobacteriia bacterium]|nr:cytochrome c biogenesis protein CcsA [Coriobacteriia bacterium]
MIAVETACVWIALFLYAASTVGFVIAVTFGNERFERVALHAAQAGLIAHAIAIGARWVRVGHGPYLGFYEVASLMAFLTVAFLVWLVWRYPGFLPVGVVVMPVAMLILGGSMLVSREAEAVTGALASLWLIIHVIFANLAYGAYVAAFALSAAFLMRDYGRDGGRLASLLERLPSQPVIDDLTYRFVGAGFVFQGVMIASGAIWANEAWGRYWGWDAIEIWSLIAWAVYAIYLHLRLTLGWKGRRAAWVAVISLPVIVFSLLGVPLVYDSIHGAYLYTWDVGPSVRTPC